MKEELMEISLEMLKGREAELNEPEVETLGNIAEFTFRKSNALEPRVYMLH